MGLPGWLGLAFSPVPIRLQSQPLPFVPNGYYIATVTDQRPERGSVARLVLTPDQPAQPVDLAGGLTGGVQQFINQSLKQDRKQRPIALRILQLRVIETAVGNRVTGQFTFSAAFDLLGKDDFGSETSTRLTTYRGSANYTRPVSQTAVIEPTIRQSIVSSVGILAEYMNREIGGNEKLATGLTVVFSDDERITNDDTVHYNPGRKLTWADFRAQPRRGSHYAAEVFTSFAYEGKSSVKDGVITINLTVKAYMLKNSSWGRADAQNAYALNHEQRHFDITRIIAERFKRKIQPDSLTLDDYNSIIQYQFIESFRDMNRMQKLYDAETRHSIDQAAQERWNGQIDAELRTFGIKRPPNRTGASPYIDHTNLRPTATETDIRQLCAEAATHRFRTVCVPPTHVLYAVDLLTATPVEVSTVVGFPLGYSGLTAKLAETEKALDEGATELDMVMNLSRFKSMAYGSVREEISTLAGLTQSRGGLLKVIIETAYLDNSEIRIACELCTEAKADFVKTSTGFAPTGAVLEDVRLMRSLLPDTIQVKASGGIKTAEQARAFIEAGASRIGTSSRAAMMPTRS